MIWQLSSIGRNIFQTAVIGYKSSSSSISFHRCIKYVKIHSGMCIVQMKHVLGLVWVKEKRSLKAICMDTEEAYHYWHTSQWISSTKYSLKCCWNHCTAMALTPSSNPCIQSLNSTNVEPFEVVLFPPCVQVCSWGMSLLFDNSCQSVAHTVHDVLCFMWWKLLARLPCCLYMSQEDVSVKGVQWFHLLPRMFFAGGICQLVCKWDAYLNIHQWRTEGGGGSNPPPKFRSFDKAEPNSQFRGKHICNNLTRIRLSLIFWVVAWKALPTSCDPHSGIFFSLQGMTWRKHKVPKLKKILPYEMKFLVPNYSCLQNPWLGG